MKASVIIPAAGSGERMGAIIKKPYIMVRGQALLAHSLLVFAEAPAVSQIIIAVSPGQEEFCRKQVVESCGIKKPVCITAGGDRRQDSVRNGLAALDSDAGLVIVHDGARPFITVQMIGNLLAAALQNRAATMAVPVKDTVAVVVKNAGFVERTLERESLYLIQTPQAFERQLICEAHHRAFAEGFTGTDDASLVERLGIAASIVLGTYDNIKITTPEDLVFAEAILQKRAAQ